MTEENTILLIEKRSSKAPTFAAALKRKGYDLEVVQTGSGALKQAPLVKPVLVVVNAASLGSSGVRICRRLRDEVDKPIIHIIDEDVEVPAPGDSSSDIVLRLPFTARKLVNRIKRLMPAERNDTIEVGHVKFVKSVRVVHIADRETRLTPKAAELLKVFLDHPGETLDRGFLMREVWNTDYVGDTRTLDVHVRWVRLAIEPEPASPRYIKTVRGVGYRFGLDEEPAGKAARVRPRAAPKAAPELERSQAEPDKPRAGRKRKKISKSASGARESVGNGPDESANRDGKGARHPTANGVKQPGAQPDHPPPKLPEPVPEEEGDEREVDRRA